MNSWNGRSRGKRKRATKGIKSPCNRSSHRNHPLIESTSATHSFEPHLKPTTSLTNPLRIHDVLHSKHHHCAPRRWSTSRRLSACGNREQARSSPKPNSRETLPTQKPRRQRLFRHGHRRSWTMPKPPDQHHQRCELFQTRSLEMPLLRGCELFWSQPVVR